MQYEMSSMADFIGEGATQDVSVKPYAAKEERDNEFCKWILLPDQA